MIDKKRQEQFCPLCGGKLKREIRKFTSKYKDKEGKIGWIFYPEKANEHIKNKSLFWRT